MVIGVIYLVGTYKVLAYSADATSITYQDMGIYETAAVTVPLLAGTTYWINLKMYMWQPMLMFRL